MHHWPAAELKHLQLGDARRHHRLAQLLQQLTARPDASIPQATASPAATKAAYRFFDNPNVDAQAIDAAHLESTLERAQGHRRLLALQDTTEIDWTRHPHTTGIGHLASALCQGLLMHSTMLVTLAGVPLGVLERQVWARTPEVQGTAARRRRRPTQDKESQKWLESLKATSEAVPATTEVIVVGDREADIFDLFAQPRAGHVQLLIRVDGERKAQGQPGLLKDVIGQVSLAGHHTVTLERNRKRPGRQAKLSIYYVSVEIGPPQNRPQRSKFAAVRLQLVRAVEENPPEGAQAVDWLLLTSVAVGDFDEAVACVEWYTKRWLIERYHYVLKSGCKVEELQLETAERLKRALSVYSIVAWRLLWLRYQSRAAPQSRAEEVFARHEWQSMYCLVHRTGQVPEEEPTLSEAVRWLGRLGGFLGRKGDGEPGVKVLWRGMRRLEDIAATWQLLGGSLASKDRRDKDVGNG